MYLHNELIISRIEGIEKSDCPIQWQILHIFLCFPSSDKRLVTYFG